MLEMARTRRKRARASLMMPVSTVVLRQTQKKKRSPHDCGQQITTGKIWLERCAGIRMDRIAAQIAHRPDR